VEGNGVTRTVGAGRPLGQQLDDLRRRNAAAILSDIRVHQPVSRSEIAANVGLSPAAVTKIMVELERAGCICEAEPAEPEPSRGRGRPRTPVTLDLDRHRFLGVHVGMRRVTAGLVDLGGNVVALRAREHRSPAADAVLSTARRLVREVVEQSKVRREDVTGYSACTGGWVSPGSGEVRVFEGLGWRDVAFADGLGVDGLPAPRIDSTVRALALAEARLAAGHGARSVLYLFVGNVIGCAHVVDGDIERGQHDGAGNIDHVSSGSRAAVTCTCGRRDCLWAVASDAAIIAVARVRGLVSDDASIGNLVDLAHGTGPDARAARRLLVQRAGKVGTAVAALIDVYDPDLVIVGGGEVATASEQFDQVVRAARERLVAGRKLVPVRQAVIVGPSGLVRGAAMPALDAFYADPLARAPVVLS
jgi:predicted NBD/HSP70 family sugar kinase